MITSTPATGLLSQSQPEPNLKPRTRVMRTQHQLEALLNEFNDSGLTRTAFCKKYRIATSSLYRWQQLLAEQSDGATEFIDVTQPLANAPASPPAHPCDNNWQAVVCLPVLSCRSHPRAFYMWIGVLVRATHDTEGDGLLQQLSRRGPTFP